MTSNPNSTSVDGTYLHQFLSAEPVELMPGEERTVAFALVGANTIDDLEDAALAAKAKYNCEILGRYTVHDIGPDIEFCDGTAGIGLAGGLGFTSWEWSTGETTREIFPTSSGLYSVVETNSWGCETESEAFVTVHPTPVLGLSDTTTVCAGEYLSAGHAGPYFSWATGESTSSIAVSTSGVYGVTVTDSNGCSSFGETYAIASELVSNFDLTADTLYVGDPLSYEDLTVGATSWEWSFGDGGTSTTQTGVYSYSLAGTYLVQLISRDYTCETIGTRKVVVLDALASLGSSLTDEGSLALYPNPNNGAFTVTGASLDNAEEYEILDIAGRVVYREQIGRLGSSNKIEVAVSNLNQGMYWLRVRSGESYLQRKFVLSH